MVQHEVLHLLVVSAGVFTACLVYRVGCGVDGQQGGGEGLTWVAADKHKHKHRQLISTASVSSSNHLPPAPPT